jgi:BirA family transcriptional regulator, biotin operon repressor / biotin---[acetyl-CoA-carboxylase] ligase
MEASHGSALGLATPWPGASVQYRERTSSTMDDARALARDGCPSGTVAAAGYQDKGRGRVPGRTWISVPGHSLLATVVLRLPELGYALHELPLRAGAAVALGIEDAAGISVRIKWPNDIVAAAGQPFGGKKLAGILCESDGQAALVGFGINCAQASFPDEIERTACSLLQVCGSVPPLHALLSAILLRLQSSPASSSWLQDVRMRLHGRDSFVRVGLVGSDRTVEGTLRDVDERGRLVVELSDGRRETVSQGELLTRP